MTNLEILNKRLIHNNLKYDSTLNKFNDDVIQIHKDRIIILELIDAETVHILNKSKIMRYRKKPIVIDAIQWNGKNFDDIMNFMKEDHGNKFGYEDAYKNAYKTEQVIISTLEGNMVANINDYIIKGIKGEFYPCREDIFLTTYENL